MFPVLSEFTEKVDMICDDISIGKCGKDTEKIFFCTLN